MDTATTPYDADALMELYNCKGQPERYRFTLAHFETRPCSRCGGSGHYSYCQRYGTMCFGCSGSGFQMTGRGAAALAYYRSLQALPLYLVQPGTPVLDDDARRCTLVANELTSSPPSRSRVGDGPWVEHGGTAAGHRDYTLEYANQQLRRYHNYAPDKLVRVRSWTPEQRQAQLASALAYQASLTKAGKPSSKRRGTVGALLRQQEVAAA